VVDQYAAELSAPEAGAGLAVETVDHAGHFAALRDEWDGLLAASASASVFLSWEWMHTWWKHLAGDRRLHLLALRRRGELVAIAPLARRSARWRRLLPFPALEFLGTGSVGSDYLDLLVHRDCELPALEALAQHLADSDLVLELPRVNRHGAHASALARHLNQSGWVHTISATDVCPYIDLTGQDWESYLAHLGPSHRYNVRRRLRNLNRRGRVRLERAEREEQRQVAFRHLVRLHRLRWHELGRPGVFPNDALLAFHEEFTHLALQRGWLRLFVLSVDDRPVAALYGLRYGSAFHFYQSGFDPEWRKHSVGLVTMALVIRHALEEGATTFDFLRGDEAYKSLWTHTHRELIRLDLFPPSTRGALCRQTMDLRWSLKRGLAHLRHGD
jgi:CelD/BcsL family acetyltransferase involved in cellulose biosynthesis